MRNHIGFLLFSAALVSSSCQLRPTDSAPLNINIPELSHFLDKPDVLRRFLLSSPDWTIRKMWRSGLRFEKKNKSIEIRIPFGINSYEKFHPEYVFQFSDKPPTGGGARSPVTVISPTAGRTNVIINTIGNAQNSNVAIGGPGLWFVFFERTREKERKQTQAALTWLSQFLKNVRTYETEIEHKGYAPGLTPADAVKIGKPSFKISTMKLSPEQAVTIASAHEVIAWINTGESGEIYIKAFNESTGQEMGPTDRTRRPLTWGKRSLYSFPLRHIFPNS